MECDINEPIFSVGFKSYEDIKSENKARLDELKETNYKLNCRIDGKTAKPSLIEEMNLTTKK